MRPDLLEWDADCEATKVGLERFMRALVCTDSHFTDSFSLAPVSTACRVSVFFRVWIPKGSEVRFMRMAAIEALSPPPVDLGWSETPPSPTRRKMVLAEIETHADGGVA